MSDLIATHLAHLRAGGYSERTIRARADILRRLSLDLPEGLETPNADELDQWLGHGGWSRWTRVTYAMHIRAFYRWAAGGHRPHLSYDPSIDMGRPRAPRSVPDPVSDEQVRLALARCVEPWRTAVILAAYAGLRCCEIIALERADITESVVLVRNGKGGDGATVPTHPFVWAELVDRPPGLVVRDRRGRPMHYQYLSARAKPYFAGIGLPGIHLHRFRHWYGTKIQQLQGDLRITQECLRHRSITSTQGYTHVADGQRRLAVSTLPILTTPQ